jgi:hypothetical protein
VLKALLHLSVSMPHNHLIGSEQLFSLVIKLCLLPNKALYYLALPYTSARATMEKSLLDN